VRLARGRLVLVSHRRERRAVCLVQPALLGLEHLRLTRMHGLQLHQLALARGT
jgi:hypothetical protein